MKRRVAKKLYKDQKALVRGISEAIEAFGSQYFQKIYQRLLWQLIYAYNREDLE